MSKVQVPGAAWVIALAVVNTLPAALNDAFPGAVWVPLVVDLLLVAAKAIQVYMPKGPVVEPVYPEAFPMSDVRPGRVVRAEAMVVEPEENKVRRFLVG